jgi:hypothetical protein
VSMISETSRLGCDNRSGALHTEVRGCLANCMACETTDAEVLFRQHTVGPAGGTAKHWEAVGLAAEAAVF